MTTDGSAGTFRSFAFGNYRLWFAGQTVSQVGFWMQVVAQAILVLDLTDSGKMLGIVAGLQFVPMLLVGAWAGVLSDRVDKRRMMMVTQSAMMLCAFVLGVVVLTNTVTVTWVLVLAGLSGFGLAFDQPVRRTIVTEIVDEASTANAVSLNGGLNHISKAIGPLLASVLIDFVGVGWCFVLNAASSIVVIAALARMDVDQIRRPERLARRGGQIRDGFRHSWNNIGVRVPLLLLGTTATLSFNWNVLFPLLATRDLDGSAHVYALLMGAMSVGGLAGSIWLARRRIIDTALLSLMTIIYGAASLVLATAPTVALAMLVVVPIGASSMILFNGGAARLQLSVAPNLRGRVMSIFSIIVLGGIAIGGPVSGWIAEQMGARTSIAIGGAIAVATGAAARTFNTMTVTNRAGPSTEPLLDALP